MSLFFVSRDDGMRFVVWLVLKSWRGSWSKNGVTLLDLSVSSLCRGHANLLCIVPILSDVSEETEQALRPRFISWFFRPSLSGVGLNRRLVWLPTASRRPRSSPGPPDAAARAPSRGPAFHFRPNVTRRRGLVAL